MFCSDYRFGFNGKEMDNEVAGTGNQYDYGFRIYNPRIGKFLSVDPLTKDYPNWSPYPFAMNRVIDGIDLDGLEEFDPNFNNIYKIATDYAKTQIKLATKDLLYSAINYAGTLFEQAKDNTTITTKAIVSYKVTVGARFANEHIEKSGSGFSYDIDFGSVPLAGVNIAIDLVTGDIEYFGKDGSTFSQGIHLNVATVIDGVPVGAGGGYTKNEKVLKEEGLHVMEELYDAGIGMAIFNITGGYKETTETPTQKVYVQKDWPGKDYSYLTKDENVEGQTNYSVFGSVGSGGTSGNFFVRDWSVKIETEVNYNPNPE